MLHREGLDGVSEGGLVKLGAREGGVDVDVDVLLDGVVDGTGSMARAEVAERVDMGWGVVVGGVEVSLGRVGTREVRRVRGVELGVGMVVGVDRC